MSLQSKETHHINLNSLIKLILYNYCHMVDAGGLNTKQHGQYLLNMVKCFLPFNITLYFKKKSHILGFFLHANNLV